MQLCVIVGPKSSITVTVIDIALIMMFIKSVHLPIIGLVTIISCQDLPITYNAKATTAAEKTTTTICPATQDLRENIMQDIRLLVKNSVLPSLNHTGNGHGSCGCGGPGWRRVAYLNMSDPTQTCPPAWELFTSPRRSCSRPSNAARRECYSVMFPVEGIQYSYSEVCGRVIGYQKGQPEAFNVNSLLQPPIIDGSYVDGMSLTYGSPRQRIWTFASAIDEYPHIYSSKCPCTKLMLLSSGQSTYLPTLVMITFVKLVCHQVSSIVILSSMLMIHCGMVKVVVQLAHAAHSTIHHGFVNNYLSQLLLI